jgi:hypothetical protein
MAGYCAGFESPGYVNRGPGFGFGRGWGRGGGGRGWRHRFHATGLTGWQRAQSGLPAAGGPSPTASSVGGPAEADTEWQQLQRQLGTLQNELAAIQQRIRQLETTAEKQPGAAGPAPA